MLLDALQCLLWVYTYSICCQMHCNVFIVGLYQQQMLLDAIQCLLWVYTYIIYCQMHCSVCCVYIPIVNIVRCIAVYYSGSIGIMLLDELQCLLWVSHIKHCQMHCSIFIVGLHLQYMLLDTLQCLLWDYTYSKHCQIYCSVFIVGLYLQYMLLDALQCHCGFIPIVNGVRCNAVSLLWLHTYSKCCQIHCSVFIVGLYLQQTLLDVFIAFIVGLYQQQMLLDAMQCLYFGSIHIVNIVRCIAMSLLWVYTYSIYCQMHCSVCCVYIPIVNIVRCNASSLLQVYTFSKCCQMHCNVFIMGLYLQ